MKVTPLLLRLYPRAWRERYGAELSALLQESGASGVRVALDLALGALREQLRAAFIDPSPKRRQSALIFLVSLGSWILGSAAAASIALALPDSGKGGVLQSLFFVVGLFGSLGVLFYVVARKRTEGTGLARGVVALTPALAALLVSSLLATVVFAELQHAHAYHLGQKTLSDLWMSAGARGIAFGPIGLGIAAIVWPEHFRSLDPQPPSSSSSSLGLGA